ncbi:MAG: adenine phosphoribosyltransferase [bacterium]|nr:adenine phosphoribosyltransferase [bacterium]
MELKKLIRSVPDFPKKGILFCDITTLIKDSKAFNYVIDSICEHYKGKKIDKVVSTEARGYLFGGALAYKLNAGVIPVRKPGKLPAEAIKEEYTLEYGTDALELHKDAIEKDEKVLVFDDLLATGGTALASCKLVERLGGKIVGISFLIELTELPGKNKLKDYDIFSLIKY